MFLACAFPFHSRDLMRVPRMWLYISYGCYKGKFQGIPKKIKTLGEGREVRIIREKVK